MTVDIYGHLIPGSNRGSVKQRAAQISATQAQLDKKEEPYLIEDRALLSYMVPKAGLEPARPWDTTPSR